MVVIIQVYTSNMQLFEDGNMTIPRYMTSVLGSAQECLTPGTIHRI